MKHAKEVTSKKLFIKELERPALADNGVITTLAIGEETWNGGYGKITTLAFGEEAK